MILPSFDTLAEIALLAIEAAIFVFYWSHCILPAQISVGARQRTLRVVQVVGWLSMTMAVLRVALWVDRRPIPAWLLAIWILLTAWYLAAWPRAEIIARISGGIDSLERLRLAIWRLNSASVRLLNGDHRAGARSETVAAIARLRANPRTAETTPLIELWLDRAEVILEGGIEPPQQNHSDFYREARRIWPDISSGRVAVPFALSSRTWPDQASTGGEDDPLEALRLVIWQVNSNWRDVGDKRITTARGDLERALLRLRMVRRTETTATLIDLWLAEGEAMLRDGPDADLDQERQKLIWTEAQRLWPDFSIGRVAIPFSSIQAAWPDMPQMPGGEPKLEPLRNLLWQISSDCRDVEDHVRDSPARTDLDQELQKLRAMPRTESTGPLIDLWLAEGEAVLRGASDDAPADERRRAIWAEVHRLWPKFTIGRVAAPSPPGPGDWPDSYEATA